ncbi:TonB-dependent receptor [Olivibacter sp. SDN3]|uniref:TonB-dependent receptor n=1 Tax=Olivibacter sp. SDN3 TaxID=2764720 RepID=UPI0021030900|nr:TonB-dependent receptor [Olivibacter sp. SDN3]
MLRLTAFMVCINMVSVYANSYSQSKISVQINEGKLTDLFHEIQRQTKYSLFYSDKIVAGKQVSVAVDGEELLDVLDKVLTDNSLIYSISGNQITIKESKKPRLKLNRPRQQDSTVTIRGKVYDDQQPAGALPGVLVRIKTGQGGATTAEDGAFSVQAKPGDILVFSSLGYLPAERRISGADDNFNVFLEEDVASLDEVVVVGYGTQKKINLTGAVSAMTGEDLESRPITNVGRGMQGLLPGVTVRNTSTVPGGNAPSIRVRGVGTWGDASPLVVIDGIPGGDLNILNPDDIESISVLKDAASSSIYGVRGANGVILVTTKTGKKGTSPNISLNSYYGRQTPTALPNFLGSPEFMELHNEATRNAGQTPVYSADQIETARNGSDPNYFANTDWIDEVYKDYAPQQGHNLNINGGGENMNYFLSYGYLGEGGLVVGDNFKANRHNVRARINTTVLDRLAIDANIGYIDRDVNSSAGGNGGRDLLAAATSIRPLVPVRFTNGSWGYHGGQSNPVALANDGGYNGFGSQEVTANLSATLQIIDGLDVKAQYGLVRSNGKRTILNSTINYYSPDDNERIYQNNFPNSIDVRDYTNLYQTFIGTVNYAKTFAEKHELSGLLGVSQEENINNYFEATRQNLPVETIPSLNLGVDNPLNTSSGYQYALQSVFGRVNYAYDSKYLFEGNFRYDGSSRFAPEVRWNWFGSASVGWVFSAENFFENLRSTIETAKLRASYGTQGNDRIRRGDVDLYYPYMSILEPAQVGSNNPIGNQPRIGFRQTEFANRIVTWEQAEKFNVGLDLTMLNGRLDIAADYFINNTNDILLNPPLPDVIGMGTNYPSQNAGAVQNKGWEVNLAWQDQIGEVKYGVNVNLSDVRNKITRLDDYAQNLGNQVRLVGHPIDALYGFIADRIAQVDDFDLVDGEYVPRFPFQAGDLVGPGDLIYRPQNQDDEAITVGKDRHILGSDIPRYTYGFRGDLAWKGIDFSFFIQGVGKADGWLTGSARHPFMNNSAMPQEVHLDRWTPENTGAAYPRFVFNRDHNTRLSSYWIENAAYLRLKNIQLGYTLPDRITEKFRASKLRFYVSAENLFTMSDFFYGYDPEASVGQGANFYPQLKTFVVGLNVNFR